MKYKLMMFSLVFIFVLVWIAGSIGSTVNDPITELPSITTFDVANVQSIMNVYGKLATFNIGGVPSFISVIFWVFNILFIYSLVVDMLLPLLQSNPWTVLIALIAAALTAVIAWIDSLVSLGDIPAKVGEFIASIPRAFAWGWW